MEQITMPRIVFNAELCSNLEYNSCKTAEPTILRVKYCTVDFRHQQSQANKKVSNQC